MKMSELKKSLKLLGQNEMIELVAELAKLDKKNMAFLAMRFQPENALTEMLEKGKKTIHNAFFRSANLSLRNAKAPLSEMKKVAPQSEEYLDLQLYYVQCGIDFTNEYGDINAAFYNSICSVFYDFTAGLEKLGSKAIYEKMKPRIVKLLNDTRHIGWGVHEDFADAVSSLSFSDE